MGQYYTPIILGKNKNKTKQGKCYSIKTAFNSYDYNNGSKLMEHSYLRNALVNAVVNFIANNGTSRLVWAGDYADGINGDDSHNYYSLADYVVYEKKKELYLKGYDWNCKGYRYIINRTKRQFVDLDKVPEFQDGWKIHPLPLLCADGNGRGGGDYHGTSMELVGLWKFNLISIGNEIPQGYKEIVPDFKEEW